MSDRLTEQQVAEAWDAVMADTLRANGFACIWQERSSGEKTQLLAFAHRIAALSASPVDLDAVKREAASKAWDAADAYLRGMGFTTNKFTAEGVRYLAETYPAPAPDRVALGDFFGVPLYADPACPTDRVVFEYNGEAVASALIHPDSEVLRRNAARVGGQP